MSDEDWLTDYRCWPDGPAYPIKFIQTDQHPAGYTSKLESGPDFRDLAHGLVVWVEDEPPAGRGSQSFLVDVWLHDSVVAHYFVSDVLVLCKLLRELEPLVSLIEAGSRRFIAAVPTGDPSEQGFIAITPDGTGYRYTRASDGIYWVSDNEHRAQQRNTAARLAKDQKSRETP